MGAGLGPDGLGLGAPPGLHFALHPEELGLSRHSSDRMCLLLLHPPGLGLSWWDQAPGDTRSHMLKEVLVGSISSL